MEIIGLIEGDIIELTNSSWDNSGSGGKHHSNLIHQMVTVDKQYIKLEE